MHILLLAVGRKFLAVINDPAARRHAFHELSQRWLVHRHQHLGPRDQRRIDGVPGDAHMAVGGSRAHLRPVGGQPGNLKARIEAGLGQHLAQQQNALSAKARHAHAHVHLRRHALRRNRMAFR